MCERNTLQRCIQPADTTRKGGSSVSCGRPCQGQTGEHLLRASNAAGGMFWATWSLTRARREAKGSLELLGRGPEQDLVHIHILRLAHGEGDRPSE
jgi:hypothetical protein